MRADYFAIQGRVEKYLKSLERNKLDAKEAARKADEHKSEAAKKGQEISRILSAPRAGISEVY